MFRTQPNIDSNEKMMQNLGKVSTVNSKTITSSVSVISFTGTYENVKNYSTVSYIILSNTNGTLTIYNSLNSVTQLCTTVIPTLAGVCIKKTINIDSKYIKFSWVSSAGNTDLLLQVIYHHNNNGCLFL